MNLASFDFHVRCLLNPVPRNGLLLANVDEYGESHRAFGLPDEAIRAYPGNAKYLGHRVKSRGERDAFTGFFSNSSLAGDGRSGGGLVRLTDLRKSHWR